MIAIKKTISAVVMAGTVLGLGGTAWATDIQPNVGIPEVGPTYDTKKVFVGDLNGTQILALRSQDPMAKFAMVIIGEGSGKLTLIDLPKVGQHRCMGCMGIYSDSFEADKRTIQVHLEQNFFLDNGAEKYTLEVEEFNYQEILSPLGRLAVIVSPADNVDSDLTLEKIKADLAVAVNDGDIIIHQEFRLTDSFAAYITRNGEKQILDLGVLKIEEDKAITVDPVD